MLYIRDFFRHKFTQLKTSLSSSPLTRSLSPLITLSRRHPHIVALTLILFFTLLIFRKTFTSGLLPFPGNLLVSFFFPWYSGGWEGYDPWTRHKAFLASDAIRQAIPWRGLAIDQLKNFHWPLWNPYNFAGTPLLANLQSSTFYPLNLIFFFLPLPIAWTLYIAVQPFLLACFTHLFARQLKLKSAAAFLSAIAVTSSSFFVIWLELGVVGHAILWLPLMLYSVDKLATKIQLRYFLLLIFASVSSILSGHLQTAMHVFILVTAYWLFKIIFSRHPSPIKPAAFQPLFLWAAFSIGLTAFQTLPAYELTRLSPMTEPFVKQVFVDLKTPWQNLVTFFAPDFFGHPATKNFWSNVYGDGTPFFGITPLFFASFCLLKYRNKYTLFWATLALIYLLYGFPGPLYHLARILPFDFLTSTAASRSLFVVVFSLSLLAGYGLDHFLSIVSQKKTQRLFILNLVIFFSIYLMLWLFALFSLKLFPHLHLNPINLATSKRNLIIPTAIFISLVLSSISLFKFKHLKSIFIVAIFLPTLFYSLYRYNKSLPFSPAKFFFPDHSIITYLQDNAGVDRSLGYGTAKFDKNFSTYYHLSSPEGYDSLRIKRYAQLIASLETGAIPYQYVKSDADFLGGEEVRRPRLMNLLGVKYIHDKNDTEIHDWNPELFKFPNDQVKMVWQNWKFKVYQRQNALNRAFLVGNYLVLTDPQQILDRLYNPDFDLASTVILEQTLPANQSISPPETSEIAITDYQPNQLSITASADTDTLLFLSDAYYPGWRATVDNQPTPIYRANFAFRAIYLPRGQHQIHFIYSPPSFYLGLAITCLAGLALIGSSIYLIRSRQLVL